MAAHASRAAEATAHLLKEVVVLEPHAGGASVQGANAPFGYDFEPSKNPHNYADRAGYEGYALQFADETRGIAELQAIDAKARELASTLYTYRSMARALPTVTGDDAHKRQMYAASFDVLHPQVNRIKELISFKERSCARWVSNLELLIRVEHKIKSKSDTAPVPCEALYMQMLHTLDMIAIVDALKDLKACLNNDFSYYKRAFQNCRGQVADAERITADNNILSPLLAMQSTMLTALKAHVQKVGGFDTVVADMASLAIEHLKEQWYMMPTEKHRYLRSAAFCLWLLDSPDKGGPNAFKHKRIDRSKFAKFFSHYPIVPMYGDMFSNLQRILERCPNWSKPLADEFFPNGKKDMQQLAERFSLTFNLPPLRTAAADFTTEFHALLARIDAGGGGAMCILPRGDRTALSLRFVETTLHGLRLLEAMACLLKEVLVFKCNDACSDEQLAWMGIGRPGKASLESVTDYERALRYNLSDGERTSLIELISLIKGLQRVVRAACGDREELLHRGIHELMQRFVHETMGGPTRKAVKYERRQLKAQLLQLRNLCADWAGDLNDLMDAQKITSKDFKNASHAEDYPDRTTPPSPTQLWLMRATVRALYDERSSFTKGSMMNEADLSKEVVQEMRDFVTKSAAFPYLMRLSSTLDELGDVGSLWMREFYLELCKRVQFPLSMSLPSILVEHTLSVGNSHLMPMLLTAFDAYTDAGLAALHEHRQQHLYIEIEAECNLLFDTLLHKFSEQLFTHFKTRAAIALLEELGGQAEVVRGLCDDPEVRQHLGKCWYLPLLSVRNARILGRPIDFSNLVAQRMNKLVRESLDHALARFEARSLDAVVDLHRQVKVARLTHAYLTEALPSIDPFDMCLREASDSVAFLSFSSRILQHTLTECLSDLVPNFAYRTDGMTFQRPLPTEFTQQPERDRDHRGAAHLMYGTRQINAAYSMLAAKSASSFGVAHAEALVSLLGEGGLHVLLSTLNSHVEELLTYPVHAYISELQIALPESTKLPSYKYNAWGCFEYFDAKLEDLKLYEELHSGAFQSFRRLGNCLSLLTLLESAVHSTSTTMLHQIPIKGAPQPISTAASAVANAWGQAAEESDLALMADEVSALSAPLASSSSLITRALIYATNIISSPSLKDAWLAGEGLNSDLSGHEETKAFHRVWSAVSYLFASPKSPYRERGSGLTGEMRIDNATLFGDGVLFAGAFLLHALCQRHRFELLDFNSHVFAIHVADPGGAMNAMPSESRPVLSEFVERVMSMKNAHDRFAAMLEARDAPTVYNVWRRM